ncbi:TRAP transporter small permease [Lentibacter algarum]|uniref:TRAP transporter small permease n=1 Tax=Lentibacter algarum TaxID=576131 RepID=UPI001C06C1B3|nr:TRAP transporter small permease [Lentibacter algarum]MBU2981322.1 TRAP transporter small permease [Lentibacter algarum]
MYRMMMILSRAMAYLGGVMLTALILLTCLSVVGRNLNSFLHDDWMQSIAPGFSNWLLDVGIGAINGDFELIEAGIAFAIFAFLPLCHLTGGHATVDIFTSRMSARSNRVLAAITGVVFAAIMVLIAVQLYAGTLSKFNTGQTTLLLEFPIWRAYALSLVGAIIAAVVAVYVGLMRVGELAQGQAILPTEAGADH